ncbi:hypothetical protein B0H13DRAFT_1974843 [Mycena leptocephala]|nr:hypothetical protein B0H13DRAFT_1974843 [Mycena leptocephala]
MRDEFVRDFWREFGEEYEGDVLKLDWGSWVPQGLFKGFSLMKEEVANGISAAEFMHGFVVDEEKGMFEWIEHPPNPPLRVEPQLPVPREVQLPMSPGCHFRKTSAHPTGRWMPSLAQKLQHLAQERDGLPRTEQSARAGR